MATRPDADNTAAPVITDEPVDHLAEIDALVDQLPRTSPSGAETIVKRLKVHIAGLRSAGTGPAPVLATRHESLVADDTLSGGRTITEVPRSGIALPAGVSIHDRSDDGALPPVPVAPAAPADVDEALQAGKSVASPVALQVPIVPVQTGISAEAERKAQEDRNDRENAKLQAERDQADRERAAAEERARLARVAPDHATPNPDSPSKPPA